MFEEWKGRRMGKLSVIVPVYKGEKTLKRCVDSILNSTYKNIELILIDDGSPDSCGTLCEQFAENDSRIRVFHKENGGQASARNYGLSHATGEYITFVDDDDEITANMYHKLVSNMAENEVDISGCATMLVFEDGSQISKYAKEKSGLKEPEYLCNNIMYQNDLSWGTVWNKIFKKELWEDVFFPEGCELEDYQVIVELFFKAKGIYFDNTPMYMWHQSSSSQSKRSFDEKTLTGLKVSNRINEVCNIYNYQNDKACVHFKFCVYFDILYKLYITENVKNNCLIRKYYKEVAGTFKEVVLDKNSNTKDFVRIAKMIFIRIFGVKRSRGKKKKRMWQ